MALKLTAALMVLALAGAAQARCLRQLPTAVQGVQGVQAVQGMQALQGVQSMQGVQDVQAVQAVQGVQQQLAAVQGVKAVQDVQVVQTQAVHGLQVQAPANNDCSDWCTRYCSSQQSGSITYCVMDCLNNHLCPL